MLLPLLQSSRHIQCLRSSPYQSHAAQYSYIIRELVNDQCYFSVAAPERREEKGTIIIIIIIIIITSRTKSFHSDAANIKIKVRELATKNIFLKLKVLALQLIL